eukprot:2649168-Prorocentrum_lima.AAC.1
MNWSAGRFCSSEQASKEAVSSGPLASLALAECSSRKGLQKAVSRRTKLARPSLLRMKQAATKPLPAFLLTSAAP